MSERRVALFLPLVLFLLAGVSQAEYGYNLPVGVTPVSHQIYDLHMLIFYICLAIGMVFLQRFSMRFMHFEKAVVR